MRQRASSDIPVVCTAMGTGGRIRTETCRCRSQGQAAALQRFEDTNVLSLPLWVEASILTDRVRRLETKTAPLWATRLVQLVEPINQVVEDWERKVWFGGGYPDQEDALTMPVTGLHFRRYKGGILGVEGSLQRFVRSAEWKGYRADVGSLQYWSYTMCGRSIFHILNKDTGDSLSLIMEESSPQARSGIHSLDASPVSAIQILRQALSDWTAGKINLLHDEAHWVGHLVV